MSASRVTSGPGDRQLEPYRRELTGYCYRMLGSIHDAEDAVQDTMLCAWRALPTFEDRVGLRPWLYRIATNVCLDLLKSRSRRALPVEVVPAATGELVRGDRRPEATWVEPAPDRLILPDAADPAERAVLRESVRLAFIAALQHLAPRQRAVLILRDMLQWRAAEVARLLDTSVDAVNSTLRRARASIPEVDRRAARVEPTEADLNLLAAYIDAFEHHDVDALVKLRRDDAILEMPPFELWMQGPHDIGGGCSPSTRSVRTSHSRQRQRSAGRRRLPASGTWRSAQGLLDPSARRHQRGASAPSTRSWTQDCSTGSTFPARSPSN
jgi:RNA polymerase sigma-70 factor, ECF subfamily